MAYLKLELPTSLNPIYYDEKFKEQRREIPRDVLNFVPHGVSFYTKFNGFSWAARRCLTASYT